MADIDFIPGSFTGRNVLIYRTSFSEIWSGLGGCFSTSLLLVAVFFMNKNIATESDSATKSVMLLRFRPPKQQNKLLKQFAKGRYKETKEKTDNNDNEEEDGTGDRVKAIAETMIPSVLES